MIQLQNEIGRIFKYGKLELNALNNQDDMQAIVNDRPFKLLEMGSGLAQFVIVLGNIILQPSAFILIDEPELNLHPALQLDFLTVLASHCAVGHSVRNSQHRTGA